MRLMLFTLFVGLINIAIWLTAFVFKSPDTDEAKYPVFRYPVPEKISWCGEELPIGDPEIRERIERQFYWMISNPNRTLLVLKRTRTFYPYFGSVLAELGMPDDLKYLAAAESALRIDAYSDAGAAGLWQFMSPTGKQYGLRVNRYVDERFHVEKSTRASIEMLKDLHEQLGSWSLAAGAYNGGITRMRKAINHQLERDYFKLHLNPETRQYVVSIALFKEFIEHPEKYGLELENKDYYKQYDAGTSEITVKGPIQNLGRWAKDQGVNYRILKKHNYWITSYELPAGSWTIRLPVDRVIPEPPEEPVPTATTQPEPRSKKRVEGGLAQPQPGGWLYVFHTVAQGDNLVGLAQTYGVASSAIRSWNHLQSDELILGSKVRVYPDELKGTIHLVERGESLASIAYQYRLSISQIRHWNNLSSDLITPGQRLELYVWPALAE